MTLLGATDRAYLTAETVQRYDLTNPSTGASILSGGGPDDFGCLWLWEEPDGWDAPEVVTPSDNRPHEHGSALGTSTLSERVLTVNGSAAAPSIADAHAARKRLLALLLSNLGGYLRYRHLDDSPAKYLYVRPSGRPNMALRGPWLDFSFVLVADDPMKYGATRVYGPVGLQRGPEGGFRTPWRAPLSAASVGSVPNVLSVPNVGDEAAHVLYVVRGPVPQPGIYLSNGQRLTLDLNLAPSDTLRVDTRGGTVMVNGVSRYDAWGPSSVFPLIPPGGVDVRLESLGAGESADASLTVQTAPAWK